jgi:tetratricopeptide (TPR) repeat protein
MPPAPDNLNSAVNDLRRALEGGPSPRVYAPLAEAYRLMGRTEEALLVAREGLEAFPRHLTIRLVLARSLADLGDVEAAAHAYKEILRDDPQNVEAAAYSESARSSAVSGPEPEPPEDACGRLQPGTLSEELEHLAELFSSPFEDGEIERPPEGIATLTLAEIYARQGLAEKAIEICEAILRRSPGDERATSSLAEYRRRLASVE